MFDKNDLPKLKEERERLRNELKNTSYKNKTKWLSVYDKLARTDITITGLDKIK